MTTFEFLSYLRAIGVKVWAEGDKLRYRAPQSALSPTLLMDLARRKSEILQALNELKISSSPVRPHLRPIARRDEAPLSFSQQRLWFFNQMEPGSAIYNEAVAIRLQGKLDVPALERTFSEIVRRHEAVRTTFAAVGGFPAQVIRPAYAVSLPVDDLSQLSESARDVEARLLMTAEARRPFDLEQGPLMRSRLLRLRADEHVAVVTMHHIITDGWSVWVLAREIGTLYQAFASGKPSPLPELEVQYADYALWQREYLAGSMLESQLGYWKRQLSGAPPTLELPADRPRPARQSYSGARQRVELGPELSLALDSVSREQGVTVFMTLMAAFQTLLHRYTGQTDILVASPVANRTQAETEGLIGFFVNTLVLRADLSGNPSFCELLSRVKKTALGAYAHQDLPFEKLIEELQPDRDLSLAPLSQVVFVLQNATPTALELSDLSLSLVDIELGTAKADLRILLTETSQGLSGWIEYSTDLFDEWRIQRIAGHFRTLAETIVADPERRILEIDLLNGSERRQILVEWNRTEKEHPHQLRVHELIAEQAERTPERIALIGEGEQVSYRELNRRANQLGRYLQRLGVGPDVVTGLCLGRSAEMVVALMGVLKAGGAYLPLDPGYPLERLSYMLEDAGVGVVISTQELELRLPAYLGQSVLMDLEWERVGEESDGEPESGALGENLAYVIYTSGSTGRPKGVMIEHSGLCNLVEAQKDAFDIGDQSRVLQFASLSFDASVWEIFSTLAAGGSLHLYAQERLMPGDDLVRVLREDRITTVTLPPTALAALSQEELPDLETVIAAGEACTAEVVERWAVGRNFIDAYGPTEATVCASMGKCEAGGNKKPSIGRPIANTGLYILDCGMGPLPVGVRGALYISGAALARGHRGRPDLTAERFVPNPFGAEVGERLYRTGDLARHLADGSIDFIGRADDQVKVRGHRIELGEVEAVLNEHPSVNQSVVVAIENERGDKRLVGYVVSDKGVSGAELRRYLRARVPEYMAPESIQVIEEMPVTSNGKIDRKRLPMVEAAGGQGGQEYVGARTPIEEILAGIFKEVLKLERVGRQDNFFEIGGHSLLATQVVSRVKSTFGVEVGVRGLFEEPTVEGFGRRVEERMRAGEKEQAPPLVRASGEGRSGARRPLSYAQQRLWFIDQLEPGSAVYNCPGAARLEGRLDLDALGRSVNEIVRRHEVLRTRIEVEEGEPAQVVEEWRPRKLEVEDLTWLTGEEREEEVRRIIREEAGTGFDLGRGPLLRVKVLKLEEERHVMLFTMHHIVSDGWSMGILIREVGELYKAYRAGAESPLEELPIQYADFAAWQRTWLQGERLDNELAYWRRQLTGMEDLELPMDHPRPATQSRRGASRHFVVEGELTGKLRSLSQQEGATLFMTLLGAFDALMSRYSGQQEVVVGTDIANRNRAEIEGLIGFFVNQLVIRVKVRDRESFKELLGRVKEVCLGAYGRQDLPFEKLVEELQPERDLSRSPLFQVKLILQNAPREELELEGLRLLGISGGEAQTSRFDLTLAFMDAGPELVGAVDYNSDLFEAETIERLIGHYKNVMGAIAENRERPISEISLLNEQERKQIVVEWNRTGKPYPKDRCVHELIAEQAERTPERIALIGERRQVSYRDLDRRANQLGHYLQRLGVGPDVLVGVCLERSAEMVVALMGVLKAGGAYLPLDPGYPLERLSYMLEDAGVGIALTEQGLEERLPAYWGQTVCLDLEWERISEESEGEPESEVTAENLAYVIYTSGSTGRPKGVMIEHSGLCNLVEAQKDAFDIGDQSRVLQFASLSFDASVWEIFSALAAGGSLHLYAQEWLMPGEDLVRVLREDRITTVTLPPTALAALSQEELPDLETVIAAGEACTAEVVERWAVGRNFIDAYGPTEATVCASMGKCEAGGNKKPSIGRPIANTGLYILDCGMGPLPVGVRGELYISGAGLARGYRGRPDLTAERFVPNPFGAEVGERLYRTGDLARHLADGSIDFIGRADDQVKVRGHRIELGEVEAVLNEHPSVNQSVVVAIENERGDKRLVGYVVSDKGVSGAELRRYLRARVPEYMAPESIQVIEEMPVTSNGKIDRKRLPMVEAAGGQGGQEYVGARTPIEEILAGIFKEVLKLERVGRQDNFFEIGGHSLLATQVVSRVKSTFGVEVGVRGLFEEPTVEGFGRRVEERMRAGEKEQAPPLVRASGEGRSGARRPLSYAQQRLWFIDQLEPGSAVYNCPGAARLEGRLDLDALGRSVNEIVRRHEVLRTRIEVEEGEPAQVVEEWRPRKLEVEDLTWLTGEEREEEVRRIIREEAGTGFDLGRGPLLRVKVLKLEEERHVMLFTMHHIVSDGWSMGILIREVGELYKAYRAGAESPLEELPIQYADFAAWQRTWLQGERLDNELAYWRRQLTGMEDLELPMDHPRPATQSRRGASRNFVVEGELTGKLRSLSQQEGATLFMTLLGAFDALMSRYSGQQEVVVGTDIANRNRAEIEGLIGFFVNQLVIRVKVRDRESFKELLGRVKEVCLGAYGRQDLPFEKLVEELQPERDLSRSPLFQVKLILQNAPREELELEGLRLLGISGGEAQTSRFDLTLAFMDAGPELVGAVDYNSDLFEAETIERLIGHYKNVMGAIAEKRERPISEISLLNEQERKQIVVEWNRTGKPYPKDRCVHELIAEQAERTPERIALIGERRQVSYRDLDRRANQLGHYLQRLGVGPDVLVGVCLERSAEMVVALMGVLKAGGAYLPLDPGYPLERLSYMLEDAGVGIALTEQGLEERLPAYWGQTVCLDLEWERISEESEGEPESEVTAENLAYVIYTSGSTGRPKGVMIEHSGLCNLVEAQKDAFDIGDQSRVLQFASLSFDASVWEIFSALAAGGSLHLYAQEWLMPGEDLVRVLREDRITTVTLPPTALAALSQEELPDLETVIAAGEACTAEVVERWAVGRNFIDAYGPTEATVCASMGKCEAGGNKKPSIGRPIANTGLYILDCGMGPLPVGVRGELYISGAGLARGYRGRPDLTAERFVPNPFGAEVGERLYRTGDLARHLADGSIDFIGRADDQVK